MSYTPYFTASQWKANNLGAASDQMKVAIDTLGALQVANESFGRQTVQAANMPITTGSSDSVSFSAYAGKKIVGIAGVVASNGNVIDLKNATGFSLTAANQFDSIFIAGSSVAGSNLLGNFNVNLTLTGVGTSASWNTGYLQSVTIFYIDDAVVNPTYGNVSFTTLDAVDTYTDSGLNGMSIGYVIYGQGILEPSQYTLTGSSITIDPGFPVEADKQLIIIPA